MRKKNRAAAAAAQRRKTKKARDGRRETVAGEGVLQRIGGYLADEGFAVSGVTDELDGSVIALELEFSVLMASGAGHAAVQSREMLVRVVNEDEYGCVAVVVPNAWLLEGVSDQRRARLYENLLEPGRYMPIGMRLHYCDGLCGPCVRIGNLEDQLPEKVSEALTHVFDYIAVVDSSVRQSLETGHWVEPEVPDMAFEDLQRETQELAGIVERQGQERLKAIRAKAFPVLQRMKKHADGGSDCEISLSVGCTNVLFAVSGRVTRMARARDLDELERLVELVVSRAREQEGQAVTTD